MRTAMAAPLSRDIFAAIYQNYSRFVAGIVAGFSLAPQQQEDVCQDVFLIVWQRQEQLQHEHAFSSWLATITRHRCLQELRRQRSMLALEDLSDATIFLEREPATVPRDQGEGWHLEMSLALLKRAIDEHRAPVRRHVAQLFYCEGQTVATIAKELDICPNTVVSHLRRFRLIVEKALLRMANEQGVDLQSA